MLNELQKTAVLAPDGPLLIIAGPGTGKTRTLIHRIAYLIKERVVPPDKILAVTFTRKAAREMMERLKRLLEVDVNNITIGTIHSICLGILRKESHHLGINPDFSITDKSLSLIPPSPLWGEGAGEGDFLNEGDSLNKISESDLLGFDDLISLTVELFDKAPEILKEHRERYKYIFVDEYQDINHNQRHLLYLLAHPSGNICAIGDPDQAIYSFRGANVENFLLFESDYPGAEVIKLQDNYRSTPVIVDASTEVIKKNKGRIDRPLQAIKDGCVKIQVHTVPDDESEGRLIINEIERFIGGTSHYSMYRSRNRTFDDRGYSFSDFAVLFRLNAQIKRVEEVFINSGIPYQLVGGKRSISRDEVRVALSYLHVIENPEDDRYILQVLNIPNRHIGPHAVNKIIRMARSFNLHIYEVISKYRERLPLNKVQKEGLKDFIDIICRLREESKAISISDLLRRVIRDTGLDGFYGGEDFSDLLSLALQYEDAPVEMALKSLLDEMELSSDIDSYNDEADAVTLMTIHASKGLEFRVVFICGVEDGLVPYTLHHAFNPPLPVAMLRGNGSPAPLLKGGEGGLSGILPDRGPDSDQVDIEEERRLFYVGMTRAMERLYMINAKERFLFGERRNFPPSPFIGDIPQILKETYSTEKLVSSKNRLDKVKKQLRLL